MRMPVTKSKNARRTFWLNSAAMLTVLVMIAGCELGDSVRDGFFGGISDLISNILNIAILGQ